MRPPAGGRAPVLRLTDLDYDLPEELIAQAPIEPRDASRLLAVERRSGAHSDRRFSELPDLLRAGDVLVRNDTRVFPARTYFRRRTGGRIEVLFLRSADGASEEDAGAAAPVSGRPLARWEALLRGRPRPEETLTNEVLGDDWPLICERPLGEGRWLVASAAARPVVELLGDAGLTPLPPYIHERLDDPERYQTTYCAAPGSAAAPTAGLHFTPVLDDALRAAGVGIETVTLDVGLGTFKPLQEETLALNRLHGERYSADPEVWVRLRAARAEGRRIIAVGTTSLRVLEHLAAAGERPELAGETHLFITPGYEFRMADGLITNFHLPRTSLLALVMAFCGEGETRQIYRHAVRQGYRFYSFGDAMVAL